MGKFKLKKPVENKTAEANTDLSWLIISLYVIICELRAQRKIPLQTNTIKVILFYSKEISLSSNRALVFKR